MIFKVLYDINEDIRNIRNEVFIIEQQIDPKDEFEGDEDTKIHCCGYLDNQLICYARLYKVDGNIGHIGRVSVKKCYRNKGYGASIVEYAQKIAKQQSYLVIELHAQKQAVKFYEKLGYIIQGEEFIEAGIPHLLMIKKL